MKVKSLAIVFLFVLLVSGCERMSFPKGTHAAEKKWKALNATNYSYVFVRNCFCSEDYFPVKVVVRADTVSEVLDPVTDLAVMDSTNTHTVLATNPSIFHTVNEFFASVKQKFGRSNNEFEVSFDETMGYPTYIDISDKTGGDGWFTYQLYDLTLE
jgi:hypothetical protein